MGLVNASDRVGNTPQGGGLVAAADWRPAGEPLIPKKPEAAAAMGAAGKTITGDALMDRVLYPPEKAKKKHNRRNPTIAEMALAKRYRLNVLDLSFPRRLAVRAACAHQQDTADDMPLEKQAKDKCMNGWFGTLSPQTQRHLVSLSRAARATEAVSMRRGHYGRAVQPKMFYISDIGAGDFDSQIAMKL